MSPHDEKPPMVENEKRYAKIHLSPVAISHYKCPKIIFGEKEPYESFVSLGVFKSWLLMRDERMTFSCSASIFIAMI